MLSDFLQSLWLTPVFRPFATQTPNLPGTLSRPNSRHSERATSIGPQQAA
jgi:hypothetical protein